jgi:protein SCO1/2
MTGTTYRPTVELGGKFDLVDHHGRAVTDQDFLGRHLLIFFGFTHCKVVCPENLSKLSHVLDLLGPIGSLLQPLYVSVDPDRDTPEVMHAFLAARFPRFLGLTGDKVQIDAMKARYRVYAEREAADANGDYDVPHSAMTFLMGPDGAYVTHFADPVPAEAIAARIGDIVGRDLP